MNRSFERVVAFAGDFSPLLALHALVPTVAAAAGREPRLSVALPLSLDVLEKHFMFSRHALREGRWAGDEVRCGREHGQLGPVRGSHRGR